MKIIKIYLIKKFQTTELESMKKIISILFFFLAVYVLCVSCKDQGQFVGIK